MLKKYIESLKNQRDLKNSIFNFLSFIITPLISLIATPLLLQNLGSELFGIWILVQSVLMILSMGDLGISTSIIKFGSSYISNSQKEKFTKLIDFCYGVSLIISVLISISTWFAGPYIVTSVFNVDLSNFRVASIAFKLIGLIVGIRLIGNVWASILMAHERYDIKGQINILFNIISSLFSIILVVLGFKIISLVVMILIVSFLNNLILFVNAVKIFPYITFFPSFNFKLEKNVISYSFNAWLQLIVNMIYSQSDRFIITSTLGPTALGYYSVCIQLASKLHEIPAAVCSFLLPKLSSLHEKADQPLLRKTYKNFYLFVLLFSVTSGFTMFIFSHDILSLWINPSFADKSTLLLRILITTFFGMTLGIVPYYYLNAIGHAKYITRLGAVNSSISVVLSLFLTPIFGVTGTAFGRLISIPTNIFIQIFIERKFLKTKFNYIRANLVPVIFVFIVGISWLVLVGESDNYRQLWLFLIKVFSFFSLIALFLTISFFKKNFKSKLKVFIK
ncbi:oligosaccharide flippase family protein [Bacillus sp. FJAT-27245]|uniref:oligosaccharide flippase family protein n=1 Tax=Bacillus sp. FJAT-27245 TaxID=1684144 RepID=UPI0006A7E344|nr:oligosaccharide flippase family protein [Bacillus sp. FJAT-27245]